MSCFQMICCPSYAAAPAPAAYLPYYYYHHDYRSPFSADEYHNNWSPKVSLPAFLSNSRSIAVTIKMFSATNCKRIVDKCKNQMSCEEIAIYTK